MMIRTHAISRRGFTLVELLLAIFLLTIGMMGLLSIFPIGADWTRQVTEDSIAQTVARDAMSIVRMRYATAASMSGIASSQLQPLPNFSSVVPLSERSYQYGAANPFPAQNPAGAVYFWTALARRSPDQTSGGDRYEVYILVMKKGQPGDSYVSGGNGSLVEVAGCRGNSESIVPAVAESTLVLNTGTRSTPGVGDTGIGKTSGTVFRVYTNGAQSLTRPQVIANEAVLWVPPMSQFNAASPSNTDPTPSPLVYVYQTTLAF